MLKLISLALLCLAFSSSLALANTPVDKSPQTKPMAISLININQANADTLAQLKGIGIHKAQAIVDYRTEFGKFQTLSDLMLVKGIGEKVLAVNAGRLTI